MAEEGFVGGEGLGVDVFDGWGGVGGWGRLGGALGEEGLFDELF
ncbi:hypothetical protein [Rappaport israeli]|nr:hypothetical protein [Rappaport israeli]